MTGITDDWERHHRARYGGPWFTAASTFRLDGGFGRADRLVELLVAGLRQPRRFGALIALLLRTPREAVVLSDSNAGQALRTYFDERFLGVFPQNRLCRGVLLLPSDHATYLRGRRRQALRTNLRRAAAAGIWCEVVTDPDVAFSAVEVILAGRRSTPDDPVKLTGTWRRLLSRSEVTVLVARGPDSRPLALTATVTDCSVSLIRIAIASDHDARWALHDYLVQTLIERGVHYLLAEGEGPFGALGFAAELHHYQHLLGYELRHLIPRTRARTNGWGVAARRGSVG